MEEREIPGEKNLHRLIQAGAGPQVRPDEAQRAGMLQQLRVVVRERQPVSTFPPLVLIALLGVLAGVGGWMVVQNATDGKELVRVLFGLILSLNGLSIPVASLVIFRRRRNVQ
jgi:hypothetical protein